MEHVETTAEEIERDVTNNAHLTLGNADCFLEDPTSKAYRTWKVFSVHVPSFGVVSSQQQHVVSLRTTHTHTHAAG